MKTKRIIALLVAMVMVIGIVPFAMAETVLPDYEKSVLSGDALSIDAFKLGNWSGKGETEEINLDYGMIFKAVEEYDEAKDKDYADWAADFEIKFSNDVKAILAGNYGRYGWIALKAPAGEYEGIDEEGYQFTADESVRLLETAGLLREDGNPFTYLDIVLLVKEFMCGVKLGDNTPLGTTVTLDLCLYEPTAAGYERHVVGETMVFDYSLPEYETAGLENLTIDAKSADDWDGKKFGTEEITLDYGMVFKAVDDYDAARVKACANWPADFEIKFNQDVKAVLAGNYGTFGWIALKDKSDSIDALDEEGYQFKADKSVRLLETAGLVREDGKAFTYADIVLLVKEFACGLKALNAPAGLEAELSLCLYEPKSDGTFEAHVIGAPVVYEYKLPVCETEEIKDTFTIETSDAHDVFAEKEEIPLDYGVKFNLEETHDEAEDKFYADWATDFEITFAKDVKAIVSAYFGEELGWISLKAPAGEIEGVDENGYQFKAGVPVKFLELLNLKNQITTYAVRNIQNAFKYSELLGLTDDIKFGVTLAEGESLEGLNVAINLAMTEPGATESTPLNNAPVNVDFGTANFELVEVDETDARWEEGKAKFDVVLSADANKTIKNFVAGEFTVKTSDVNCDYDIVAANAQTTVSYIPNADGTRTYKVYLNSFDKTSSWTTATDVKEFVLGTLTVVTSGEGKITLSDVSMSRHDDSTANKRADIETTVGKAVSYNTVIPPKKLTINVTFNNPIENVAPEYNDMKVTISGGDIAGVIETALGKGVTFNKNTCTYTVVAELTKYVDYNVTVSGEGYRTARYTVSMDEDKTLNFWNNAFDTGFGAPIEVGTTNIVTSNFLAGDIVKNEKIDKYDLSAVVSFFGEKDLANTNPTYVKYDLNRDKKIDSKDIAYVLVSWDK